MDATKGLNLMSKAFLSVTELGKDYADRLNESLSQANWSNIEVLAETLLSCWRENRQVFICGNGGSAGNAIHLANDFIYGIARKFGSGLNVHALPANSAVMSCLANDEGYEHVFSYPLGIHAGKDDVLIVLSGSGNSPNILEALRVANLQGMQTFAILGYTGGKALDLADYAIHFPVNDMQISEDLQLSVGHILMQWLHLNRNK